MFQFWKFLITGEETDVWGTTTTNGAYAHVISWQYQRWSYSLIYKMKAYRILTGQSWEDLLCWRHRYLKKSSTELLFECYIFKFSVYFTYIDIWENYCLKLWVQPTLQEQWCSIDQDIWHCIYLKVHIHF